MIPINNIEFNVRDAKALVKALSSLFDLCKDELTQGLQNKLIEDFGYFVAKGKWQIHNSYNGGFIFLREPEKILDIQLKFKSDEDLAIAIVEFENEIRNIRNVKYKPNAGKTDQSEWKLKGVFPNFGMYPRSVKIYLISALAKIGKEICEKNNKDSWYTIYTHDFEIKSILDGEVVDTLEVLYLRDENSPKQTD